MGPREALSHLQTATSRTTAQLIGSATNISSQSSEVVLSIFSGASGCALAYVVSVLDKKFSFSILGTLATLIGLSGGILAGRLIGLRQTPRDKLQAEIEANRDIDRHLRTGYRALPRGATAEKQEQLDLIMNNERKLAALMGPVIDKTTEKHEGGVDHATD